MCSQKVKQRQQTDMKEYFWRHEKLFKNFELKVKEPKVVITKLCITHGNRIILIWTIPFSPPTVCRKGSEWFFFLEHL